MHLSTRALQHLADSVPFLELLSGEAWNDTSTRLEWNGDVKVV